MSKVRVANFSLSIDGFGAGPAQDLEHPLGENGMELHEWFFDTRTFRAMQGKEGGATGIDDDFARRGLAGVGAWILGRNMFGPVRGPWPDESWRGWWGETPPYHAPVFVLTHHARPPLQMQGGTTFTFVTGGIREALDRAVSAAGGKDVQVGGGASTIRQYLREGLLDELRLAIAPVLLGKGEALFEGMDWRALGYRCTECVAGEKATHVTVTKGQRA
ncbi:MAG TPA: dihydrofolate reductase family protein [Polyangiaceae bacterium]|jgi:dihydrofolate reductase